MFFRGFRFGMILQFAVGPMCLLVFNTAVTVGFWSAITLVSAIASADALYITLACLGAARFMKNEKTRKGLRIFGGVVLVVFGLNMVMSALGISLIPAVSIINVTSDANIFIKGFLLTLSNPLTIIFWSGVLTAQLAEQAIKKSGIPIYAAGLISSTLFFLTVVAGIGLLANQFLSDDIIMWFNITVGAVITVFGVKMLVKNERESQNPSA